MGDIPQASAVERIGRYTIERVIQRTELSEVYLGRDPAGTLVCVKRPRPERVITGSEMAMQFHREGVLLGNVFHSNVVRVLEVGEDNIAPFLCLEYVEGRSLEGLIAGGPFAFREGLGIIRQIALGLAAVHEQGIVHSDLKPANVLVRESSDQREVKVVDFGLAVQEGRRATSITGTLRYMAPEQTRLVDWPIDSSTDLYSLGVIAFELFTGRPPFEENDPARLLAAHVSSQPPRPSELRSDLPPILGRIILKLLEKVPARRYRTATGLARDLEQLEQRLAGGEASPEFVLDAHNESLPQLRKIFVGREPELAQLVGVAGRVRGGRLLVTFIAGVAGVGKSSLVREFRNRSLTSGLQFAIGKCREVARGIPYYVLTEAFADYFRQLGEAPEAFKSAMFARMREALGELQSDLVGIIPAFAAVFPDAKKASGGTSARQPLLHLLTQVLHAVATPELPLVLLLDDLQWADAGARQVIELIAESVPDCPVLVLGTYRSEEVGADHPLHLLLDKLREQRRTSHIRLEAFDAAQTSLFVAESLRVPVATLPADLNADIHRITGGNALFVVEVINALFASGVVEVVRGQPSFSRARFASMQLPGSVADMVARRVQSLDRADIRLLGAAALVGCAAPLELLAAAAKVSKAEAFAAAQVGVREQVLEYGHDGQYRFAHDRIQQACAGLLAEGERPAVHRRIVAYLEAQPTANDPDRPFVLAEHASKAGDAQLAWTHCKGAAAVARERNTTEQVLTYSRRAVQHGTACGAGDNELRPLRSQIAEALELLGRDGESTDEYQTLLAQTSDSEEKARLTCRLAYLSQKASRFVEADRRLGEALKLLDLRISDHGVVLFGWLLFMWAHIRARFFGTKPSTSRSALIVEILSTRVACILWSGVSETREPRNVRQPLYLAYRLLAEAEAHGASRELATAHRIVFLPIAQQRKPRWGAATKHLQRAIEIAEKTGSTLEVGVGRMWMAVALCWSARYREALQHLPGAMDVLRSTGNMIQLANVYIYWFWALKGLGRIEEATANARALLELGERIRRPATIANACLKLGDALHLRGDSAAAETNLARGLTLAADPNLANEAFHGHKIRGDTCLREQRFQEARHHYEIAVDTLETPGMWMYQAFVSDTYLGYAEAVLKDSAFMTEIGGIGSARGSRIRNWVLSRLACERHLYVHLGYAYRVLGLLRRTEGRSAAARSAFMRSVKVFGTQGRPIDAALALLDAATTLKDDYPKEFESWVYRARSAFEEHGSPPMVVACDRLLRSVGAAVPTRENTQAVQALEELIKIGQAFAQTRDPQILLERIVESSIALLGAERGFVFTRAMDGAPLEFSVGRTADARTLTASEAQISMGVVARVDGSGQGVAISDTTDDEGLRHQHSVVAYNVRSVLCVPLTHVGQRLGVLYLDNQVTKAIHGSRELELLQTLASQASVALVTASQFRTIEETSRNLDAKVHERTQELELANVQLGSMLENLRNTTLRLAEARRESLEKEMVIARTIQTSMVPPRQLTSVGTARFCGAVQPTGLCGGDIWTYIQSGSKLFFFMGDVTGHGVGPAMVTAMAKSCFDTLIRERKGHVQLGELLNMLDYVISGMVDEQVQMTGAAAEIDFEASRVALCAAAHEPMILLDTTDGRREPTFILEPSLPLGKGKNQPFVVTTLNYQPGDRLVLFTDGLVEQENRKGVAFGLRRLTHLLNDEPALKPDGLLTLTFSEVDRFAQGTPQADDISLLIVDLDATRVSKDEPLRALGETPLYGPG